ncbi:Methyl-accepting chemotaxis protein [hydrothermal vent metagenome]|uniref:Methyl-accepting chemotaxis protein n=1 Tax=hydrothermal vent metagenome TaxID=652676 RepID=A0A3B0ZZV9_9ZZZZ
MTIKHRLFLLSAVITTAALLILALQQYTTQRSDLLRHGITTLMDVEADMQALLAAEQSYLLTHSQESRNYFFHEQQSITEELHELNEIMALLDLDTRPLDDLHQDLDTITAHFSGLEKLVQTIGLNENKGLRGSLRTAAHQVEIVFSATGNYHLLTHLLMMRRHEKDFLLRLDNKYTDRYDHAQGVLLDALAQAELSPSHHNETSLNLNTYADSFHRLVDSKRQLGLSENDGLRAELGNSINQALQNQGMLVQTTLDAIKQARTTQDKILFTSTLILIITLVSMTLLMARSISRSLTRITEAMEHVANGTAALSVSLPEEGRDETTQIARAFNRFTHKLDQTVQQVLMVATNLSQSSLRAQEITHATSSSIEEQVKAITQLGNTVEQMADSSQQVSEAVYSASETAQDVRREAVEGRAVVNSAVDGMQEMQHEIEQLEQSISALTGHHQDVGQVLDMIVTIAEQTNLLALNAAIEAARAGEQGRGFAVVADEVRALSKRTTDATGEVRKLMDTIRTGNQEAVGLMTRSAEVSTLNLERTQAAGETFALIATAVEGISDSNVQVAAQAGQQSELASTVRDNIQKIDESVRDLSELARNNISDNGDLSQFSVQLELLVAGFTGKPAAKDDTAAELPDNVDLF